MYLRYVEYVKLDRNSPYIAHKIQKPYRLLLYMKHKLILIYGARTPLYKPVFRPCNARHLICTHAFLSWIHHPPIPLSQFKQMKETTSFPLLQKFSYLYISTELFDPPSGWTLTTWITNQENNNIKNHENINNQTRTFSIQSNI